MLGSRYSCPIAKINATDGEPSALRRRVPPFNINTIMGEGGYKQINKTLNAAAFEDLLSYQQRSAPRLPDVEQISPRVLRILGQNAGKVSNVPG